MTCQKCKTKMVDGIAIQNTYTGIPDFPGDKYPTTISAGGPGKMIACWKCPECGWSVAKGERNEFNC